MEKRGYFEDADGQRNFTTTGDWEVQDGIIEEGWTFGVGYDGALPGDSGGVGISDATKRLCSIISGYVPEIDGTLTTKTVDLEAEQHQKVLREFALDLSHTHFVGQCNPEDRSTWEVARTVAMEDVDADGDSMPDACDPGPFNRHPDLRGDFSRTEDDDDDGVDDAFDNCPDTFNPYPVNTAGRLQPQPDADADGVGDACDLCPGQGGADNTGTPLDRTPVDTDRDGVGDRCDNCVAPNYYRACKQDIDCVFTRLDGAVVAGKCLNRGLGRGACPDGESSCWTSGEVFCPLDENDVPGACTTANGPWGNCTLQMDDTNGNGRGGRCDRCDTSPDQGIVSNSNRFAEEREHMSFKDDQCDDVPLYISRPAVQLTDVLSGQPLPGGAAYNAKTHTLFTGTPSMGLNGKLFLANAGHRWSTCWRKATATLPAGPIEDKRDCFESLTTTSANSYYEADPDRTSWRTVTTSFKLVTDTSQFVGAAPGVGTTGERGKAFWPVLSSVPDLFYHRDYETLPALDPGSPPELRPEMRGRIGNFELLFWHHSTDIDARRVDVHVVDGEVRTYGLFRSHVNFKVNPFSADLFASARDRTIEDGSPSAHGVPGGLRDHYAYVQTPFTQAAVRSSFPGQAQCAKGPCWPSWRPDWLVHPEGARQHPTLIQSASAYGLIRPTTDGTVGLLDEQGGVSLAPVLSSIAVAAFRDQNLVAVQPAGRGFRVREVAPNYLGVLAPKVWRTGGTFRAIRAGASEIVVSSAGEEQRVASFGQVEEPSSRDGQLYALDARAQSLFMVGGTAPSKQLTREVWSLDATGSWLRLLQRDPARSSHFDPAPADVDALVLDEVRGKLYLVDHVKVGLLSVARLVEVDVASRAARVLLSVPKLGLFARVDLGLTTDGSVVLVGQFNGGASWTAFLLTPTTNGVSWRGVRLGAGSIATVPSLTDAGLLLPLMEGAKLRLQRLERGDFVPGAGCAAM